MTDAAGGNPETGTSETRYGEQVAMQSELDQEVERVRVLHPPEVT